MIKDKEMFGYAKLTLTASCGGLSVVPWRAERGYVAGPLPQIGGGDTA
jgi:hypothetical protein